MPVELANPQVRKIPGIAIAYAGFGRPIDNAELIREFEDRWQTEKQAAIDKASLAGSGIVLRYGNQQAKVYRDAPGQVREEMISAATALSEATLAANNWDKADLLIGVSSFPPDRESRWVAEIANKVGVKEIGEVNATCNGSALALVEALRNPAYQGNRILVAAVEPLAWCTELNDFMSRAIFGNGGAVLALERERFEILHTRTVVQKDTEGVIKVPKSFEPEGFDRQTAQGSSWFEVTEGSEGIVTYKDGLVRIAQPEPVNDPYALEMNGTATARYFTKLVTDALVNELEHYYSQPGAFDNPIGLVVGHQPSKPVFNLVERRLQREIVNNSALAGIPAPDMPWVLEKAKMSNISPGTVLIALAENLDRIQTQDRLFTMLAYGVGSSSSVITVRYRE